MSIEKVVNEKRDREKEIDKMNIELYDIKKKVK